MDKGACQATVHGVAKGCDTTEQLTHTHTHTHTPTYTHTTEYHSTIKE